MAGYMRKYGDYTDEDALQRDLRSRDIDPDKPMVALTFDDGPVASVTNGVLDVLSGDVNPSGRLSDTIAYDITDYPSTKNYGDADRNFYEEDIYVGYRYYDTFQIAPLFPFGYQCSTGLDRRSDPPRHCGP